MQKPFLISICEACIKITIRIFSVYMFFFQFWNPSKLWLHATFIKNIKSLLCPKTVSGSISSRLFSMPGHFPFLLFVPIWQRSSFSSRSISSYQFPSSPFIWGLTCTLVLAKSLRPPHLIRKVTLVLSGDFANIAMPAQNLAVMARYLGSPH